MKRGKKNKWIDLRIESALRGLEVISESQTYQQRDLLLKIISWWAFVRALLSDFILYLFIDRWIVAKTLTFNNHLWDFPSLFPSLLFNSVWCSIKQKTRLKNVSEVIWYIFCDLRQLNDTLTCNEKWKSPQNSVATSVSSDVFYTLFYFDSPKFDDIFSMNTRTKIKQREIVRRKLSGKLIDCSLGSTKEVEWK